MVEKKFLVLVIYPKLEQKILTDVDSGKSLLRILPQNVKQYASQRHRKFRD
jgi:hypothetical protein